MCSLNNLNLSEKGIQKLLEDSNFKAFADKLHDDDIANSFMQVCQQLVSMSATSKAGCHARFALQGVCGQAAR